MLSCWRNLLYLLVLYYLPSFHGLVVWGWDVLTAPMLKCSGDLSCASSNFSIDISERTWFFRSEKTAASSGSEVMLN